jgi:hypothetical protein
MSDEQTPTPTQKVSRFERLNRLVTLAMDLQFHFQNYEDLSYQDETCFEPCPPEEIMAFDQIEKDILDLFKKMSFLGMNMKK